MREVKPERDVTYSGATRSRPCVSRLECPDRAGRREIGAIDLGAGDRSAAIKLPEEQPEGDDVRQPHLAGGDQQLPGLPGIQRAAGPRPCG